MYLCLLLGAALLAACSNPSDVVEATDVTVDGLTIEVMAEVAEPDVPLVADVPPVDVPWDFQPPEEVVEEVAAQCEGEGGCFLDPCLENSDCQSGWCVEHMGEGVCSQHCQEDCPPGWLCKQVGASDPDLVFICVSGAANLCKPCAGGTDCKTVGGAEDVCVDYDEQGSFCGGVCATTDDCPWGFSCLTTVTVDGISTLQCVSDSGVCPCTGKSVALGLWTPCESENGFGLCAGKRVCLEDGLSDCDALEPQGEECNALDDDCDGEADEPNLVDGEYIGLCDDQNECTSDSCSGEAGCQHEALDGGECKDGDACTVGDHCTAGVCAGSPVECDDSNPCTDDTCDGFGGCAFEFNEVVCDDDDVCTVADRCDGGECSGVSVACECEEDGDCGTLEDGDLCNGTLICDTEALPHVCVVDPSTTVACPAPEPGPDAPCLAAACDPATGACSLAPTNQGWACNDGDLCTVGEACDGGECVGGQAANCADGNLCTDDGCDPQLGCEHTANQAACSDNDACTIGDVCLDGGCESGADTMNCTDGNQCTVDSCDAATGCVFTPFDGGCSDGNACTDGDICKEGSCVPGDALVCADENVCTSDSCDAATGCVFKLNSAPCNDQDLCTTGDHCQLGDCIGGGVLPCSDGNPCTDDSCDAEAGCSYAPNADPCSDGDSCTDGDSCANGWCKAGPQIDCDDNDPCTDDWCDVDEGCLHQFNIAPCSDDNACTIGDACHLGECVAGIGVLICDDELFCNGMEVCDPSLGCVDGDDPEMSDGVPCTSDLCDEENDIVIHVTVDALCDDEDYCNGTESCNLQDGCLPGTPVAVDDGHECTLDSCDEEEDQIVHVPDDGLCDDATECTLDSCDVELGCQYEKVDGCGGPHYVLKGDPDPATVFNVVAETHWYPNNLVNGIWHGPSNKIIAGHSYNKGYWSYDADNGSYTTIPNMGSGDWGRLVLAPQTRVVVRTDNHHSAPSASQISIGSIDDEGNLSAFQQATFSDGFNGDCHLMSTSPSDFMCFDGAVIRHYSTLEGSHVLTYVKTTGLSPAPHGDFSGGSYQGTFAWDGKYYYFSFDATGSNNVQYEVYSEAGTKLNTYSAGGGKALVGAYFDWSCGRYTTHDGYGQRQGGNLHWPTDGSQGDDSQTYGPQSPYHEQL
jgi:hypothetical protein